jgi:hypothetical protein
MERPHSHWVSRAEATADSAAAEAAAAAEATTIAATPRKSRHSSANCAA